MMIGSLMGAVAFQKGLGIVHSLAHPLSSVFNTHHGLANAIMISHGVKYNFDAVKEKYLEVSRILNTKDLVSYLKNWNEEIDLPNKLSSQEGITKNKLEILAELASKDFCLPSNPKTATKNQLLEIYQEAL